MQDQSVVNTNLDEPIELTSYDPSWPTAGASAIAALTAILEDMKPTIEHIGSTAVPVLAAKPIYFQRKAAFIEQALKTKPPPNSLAAVEARPLIRYVANYADTHESISGDTSLLSGSVE